MAKHTPGPWSVGSTTDPHWMREVRSDLGLGIGWCGSFPQEVAHANARLMAAAPDGLAAAQDALIALEAAPDTVTTKLARQKLRAFIAKATGEQS